MRITRELNNIHLETESRSSSDTTSDPAALILECHTWFDKIIHMLNALDEDIEINTHYLHSERAGLTQLTEAQVLYLNKLLIDLKEMFYDLEKLAEKAYVINVA